MKTLTIAIPTIGRPTLRDTLASIARQALIPGDRVFVVYDSFAPDRTNLQATRNLVESFGFTFAEHDGGYHFYGNPQLNRAMELATGDCFCALGDDDVYVDGAIARLRNKLSATRAVLFQFYTPPYMIAVDNPTRLVLWQDRRLRVANLSGCCIAAPRSALVPVSDERRIEVDFDWIAAIVANTGQPPIWFRDCLIIARPDQRPEGTVHAGVAQCPGCGAIGFCEDFTGRLCGECAGIVIPEYLGCSA
jgi:glycosyltransferase involved in cell wall biosynthesis